MNYLPMLRALSVSSMTALIAFTANAEDQSVIIGERPTVENHMSQDDIDQGDVVQDYVDSSDEDAGTSPRNDSTVGNSSGHYLVQQGEGGSSSEDDSTSSDNGELDGSESETDESSSGGEAPHKRRRR